MLLPTGCAPVYRPAMECALTQGAYATASFLQSFARDLFERPVSVATERIPITAVAYATRFKAQLRVLLDLPIDGKEPPATGDEVVMLLRHEATRYRNLLVLDLLMQSLIELRQQESNPERHLAELAAVATLQENGAFGCLRMSDLSAINQLCCRMPPPGAQLETTAPVSFEDYANLFRTTPKDALAHWDVQFQKLCARLTGFDSSNFVAVGDRGIARSALRIAYRMRHHIVSRMVLIRLDEHTATSHQLAVRSITSFIHRQLWMTVLDALFPVLALIRLEYSDPGFQTAIDIAYETHISLVHPDARSRPDRLSASYLPHVSLDPLNDFTVPICLPYVIDLSESNDSDGSDESNGPNQSTDSVESLNAPNDGSGTTANSSNDSTETVESNDSTGSSKLCDYPMTK